MARSERGVPAAASTARAADSDGDGTPDADDVCPHEPGTTRGCPCLSIVTCLSLVVLEPPTFEPRSAALTPGALDAVAQALLAHPEVALVELEGHCDATEPAALAQQRADVVRAALIARGIAPERLVTSSAGSAHPRDGSPGPRGRARNRRVELHVR